MDGLYSDNKFLSLFNQGTFLRSNWSSRFNESRFCLRASFKLST